MMKCEVYKMKFYDGVKILPIMKYVVNEKRGDSPTSPVAYVHLACVTTKEKNVTTR